MFGFFAHPLTELYVDKQYPLGGSFRSESFTCLTVLFMPLDFPKALLEHPDCQLRDLATKGPLPSDAKCPASLQCLEVYQKSGSAFPASLLESFTQLRSYAVHFPETYGSIDTPAQVPDLSTMALQRLDLRGFKSVAKLSAPPPSLTTFLCATLEEGAGLEAWLSQLTHLCANLPKPMWPLLKGLTAFELSSKVFFSEDFDLSPCSSLQSISMYAVERKADAIQKIKVFKLSCLSCCHSFV